MKAPWIESFYKFCPHCAAENPKTGTVPFRCQRCGFANFFGPVAAVGALVANDQNELLLVRRARDPGKGKWGLPGGFVDREETIEQAMRREVYEETGLQVIGPRYLMSYPNHYDYRGMIAPVIDIFYCCQADPTAQVSLAEDELEQFEWARPAASHLDQMAFPSNRMAIEYWLSRE